MQYPINVNPESWVLGLEGLLTLPVDADQLKIMAPVDGTGNTCFRFAEGDSEFILASRYKDNVLLIFKVATYTLSHDVSELGHDPEKAMREFFACNMLVSLEEHDPYNAPFVAAEIIHGLLLVYGRGMKDVHDLFSVRTLREVQDCE